MAGAVTHHTTSTKTTRPMDEDNVSRASTDTPGAVADLEDSPRGSVMKKTTASRKSHRKTRTGCKTCKQRKIKCDENRPCNNCIKHSVKCDFLDQPAPSTGPYGHGFSHHGSPASSSGGPQVQNLPSFDRFTAGALHDIQPQTLQMQELELLHNYATNTASTLHNDPSIKTLMRVAVPQLGFQYSFVMRGVLAISALHLSRFKRDQSDYYIAQALYHQDIGLREASSLITNITEENCSAVYIFSALTFYTSLAKPRKEGDFFIVGEEGVADWLFLVKGSSYIMQSSYVTLIKGPFGPLFEAGSRRHQIRLSLADINAPDRPGEVESRNNLEELRTLIHTNVEDPHLVQAYYDAIDSLRMAFLMADRSPGFETGDVFVWVYEARDPYLQKLREQAPEALCVLAYFCVLLKILDHYWWVEGWSFHLISKIYQVLDEEHRLWIRWPIEQIGWIPS